MGKNNVLSFMSFGDGEKSDVVRTVSNALTQGKPLAWTILSSKLRLAQQATFPNVTVVLDYAPKGQDISFFYDDLPPSVGHGLRKGLSLPLPGTWLQASRNRNLFAPGIAPGLLEALSKETAALHDAQKKGVDAFLDIARKARQRFFDTHPDYPQITP